MADVSRVTPQTWTNIVIRPQQYTDPEGNTEVYFRVEIGIDGPIEGRGRGKSLGQALVAAGLDMMGVEANLLGLTLELVRKLDVTHATGNQEGVSDDSLL